jgi:hypothetical protein
MKKTMFFNWYSGHTFAVYQLKKYIIMKNLIKKILLVTVLMFAMKSNAAEKNLTIEVISSDSKEVQLLYNNHDGSSELIIKDINSFQLFKVLIKEKEFFKRFDLSTLPEGQYFFEFNGQTKIRTIPFYVASNKIEIKEETIIHKPIVRFMNNIVYISKVTFNKESLEVFLYDENHHLLYNEKLFGKINLNRKLSLSNLDRGYYRLALKTEGKLYNEILKKTN